MFRFRHSVIRQLRRKKLDSNQLDSHTVIKPPEQKLLEVVSKVASSKGLFMCANAIRGK